MPSYNPPLRDMQFVLHEVLNVTEELKVCAPHAEIDVDTSTPCWKKAASLRRK